MTTRQNSGLFSLGKSIDNIPRRNSLKITITQRVTSLFSSPSRSSFQRKAKSPNTEPTLEIPVCLPTPPTTPSVMSFSKEEETGNSLAGQIQEILGSTLDQVDEEIDEDWEKSRIALQEALCSKQNTSCKITL